MNMITSDLNHDGHEDVITPDYYPNDVTVLMGNGDGTFQAARSFPAGMHPSAVVAGDFNGDGRVDLAVADAGGIAGAGEGVSILLGNGDGTFQAPIFYPAAESPSSIVAGDFTGNGILDLAVAYMDSSDVTILFGDGLGSFPTSIDVPLGSQSDNAVSIVAGDFTGSGALDLAVGEEYSDSVSILEGNGQGGFRALPPFPLLPANSLEGQPSQLAALVAGDFLGNGSSQLAALSVGSDLAGTDQLSLLADPGDGEFNLMPPIVVGAGLSPTSMVAGHFFGDGQLDLAITDQYSGTVTLLQGDGRGGFPNQTTVAVGNEQSLNAITTDSFTGNGLADLAIATESPDSVVIELNQGNGQFAPPGPVGLAPQNTPLVADFGGEGVPDVAIVDGAGDILFRQGQPGEPGSFSPPVTVNPGRPSRDIAAVVTNQGTLLASVDADDNNVSLFADQNGSFSFVFSLATGDEPAQIVSADLDGNGQDDLVIRNAGDGTLTVFMSDGHGGFLAPYTLAIGSGISDVSVEEVTGDGLLDILLANQTAGLVEVIMNLGGAGFSAPTLYRAGTGLSAVVGGTESTPLTLISQEGTVGVAAAALVPGGPPDLVTLNSGSETIGILDGMGAGSSLTRLRCRPPAQPWPFASPTSRATGSPTWRSLGRAVCRSGWATARAGLPPRALTTSDRTPRG